MDDKIYYAALSVLKDICDNQAEDEGLWAESETATEEYLQMQLRLLTAAAENLINLQEFIDGSTNG